MIKYILHIATDSYSGNFHREMVAYMTGTYGECNVGMEYAEIFAVEEPDTCFDIGYIHTEYGDASHDIAHNADGECNDIMLHFNSMPNDNEITVLVRRAKAFPAEFSRLAPTWANSRTEFSVIGMSIIREVTTRTTDAIELDIT